MFNPFKTFRSKLVLLDNSLGHSSAHLYKLSQSQFQSVCGLCFGCRGDYIKKNESFLSLWCLTKTKCLYKEAGNLSEISPAGFGFFFTVREGFFNEWEVLDQDLEGEHTGKNTCEALPWMFILCGYYLWSLWPRRVVTMSISTNAHEWLLWKKETVIELW